MSIYGKNESWKKLISGSLDNLLREQESEVLDEDACFFDFINEAVITEGAKLPSELIMSEEDIFSASKFKSKTTAIIKFYKENNVKPKKIAKDVYMWYFAILGNTFGGNCKKYEPKLGYYSTLVKAYCDDKQKARIKKDIEKTITSLDKIKNSKGLNPLQQGWYKDITSNVNKF